MLIKKKQTTLFVAKNKIGNFRWKFKILKTCIYAHKLENFPILKDFSDELNGDINKCDFLILYCEMCEDLYNSVNQYVSIDT